MSGGTRCTPARPTSTPDASSHIGHLPPRPEGTRPYVERSLGRASPCVATVPTPVRQPDRRARNGTQIPTQPAIEDAYDAATLEVSEELVRYYDWLLHRVSDSIGGRILEVGAGIGTLSARVEPLSADMVLVEPAANLCRHLEERFAGESHVKPCLGTLEQAMANYPEVFEPGFDTIVAFNVLEHIEDDVGTLETAASVLRPDGHVVLFVPSLPFLYGAVDAEIHHYRRYTKTGLSEVVASAGLSLQRIEYFDFLGIVSWFISSRVLRRTPSISGLRRYDQFVVPVCRAFDGLAGRPLGKSLIAVAGPSA